MQSTRWTCIRNDLDLAMKMPDDLKEGSFIRCLDRSQSSCGKDRRVFGVRQF